jgi:hypothetical protein
MINQRVKCLINPGIVFTFTRQRWSIVPPSVHTSLGGVKIDQMYAIYLIYLLLTLATLLHYSLPTT